MKVDVNEKLKATDIYRYSEYQKVPANLDI